MFGKIQPEFSTVTITTTLAANQPKPTVLNSQDTVDPEAEETFANFEKGHFSATRMYGPQFIGLDPDYASTLTAFDYTPDSSYSDLPIDQRALEMDHRHPKIAQSQTTKSYEGHDCKFHYPGQHCPAPGACPPPVGINAGAVQLIESNGACVQWRRGALPDFQLVELRDSKPRRKTTAKLQKWDVSGHWEDPLWKLDDSELAKDYRLFSPNEMHSCLSGRRILIRGDSLMRHVFNRLIQHSRSMPTYLEYSSHEKSIYRVYNDGTDFWDFSPLPDDWSKLDEEALFSIYFDWLPLPDLSDTGRLFQDLAELKIDHLIIGFNYWHTFSDDFSAVPGLLTFLWDITNWDGVVSYYATPQKNSMTEWWFAPRNELLRSYATTQGVREQRQIHIIPSDRMAIGADKQGWPQRGCSHSPGNFDTCEVDLHWAPSYLAHYPLPIDTGLNGFVAPMKSDCRDIFNLNVIQNWLNAICD